MNNDNMVKYTCNSCGYYFIRLSNMPQKSAIPCAQCDDGVMTLEEV